MTPEGKVKADIKKVLKEMGAYYTMPVTGGYGNSGVPDFIVCYRGVFFGIEAKANNGRLTELQKKGLEKINDAGGRGFLVYPGSVSELKKAMDSHVNDLIFSQQFKRIDNL
jgi:hypothetical protein